MKVVTFYKSITNDSDRVPFRLSVITSSTQLNKTITFEDGELVIAENYDQFDSIVETADCLGLQHFQQLLETMDDNQAFASGHLCDSRQWMELAAVEWTAPSECRRSSFRWSVARL